MVPVSVPVPVPVLVLVLVVPRPMLDVRLQQRRNQRRDAFLERKFPLVQRVPGRDPELNVLFR